MSRARAIKKGAEAGAGRGEGVAGGLIACSWGRFGEETAQGGCTWLDGESALGAGWLPTDRLIELELGRWLGVLRVIGRGVIPVDGVPPGRGMGR